MLIAIAAHDQKRGIGKNNDIPWRKAPFAHCDMKHFMKTTTGHTVVMGRKTWESIPKKYRPLSDRTNIVITRQEDYEAEGAIVCDDVVLPQSDEEKFFIIGGSEIYKLYEPYLDEVILSAIPGVYTCDTHWPIDMSNFQQTQEYLLDVISVKVTHYARQDDC